MAYANNPFENDRYDDFLVWLQKQSSAVIPKSDGSIFTYFEEKPFKREFTCPEHATGLDLLMVFVHMVTDEKFTIENSYRVNAEQHLLYEIKFTGKDRSISCRCGATPNQPGNARIEGYGSYDFYKSQLNLKHFAEYFEKFLYDELNPAFLQEWKVAVFLLFEIARRIPEGDIYRHIPIAIGIQMALQLPEGWITAEELFRLFKGPVEERTNAFIDIEDRWKEYLLRNEKIPHWDSLWMPYLPQADVQQTDGAGGLAASFQHLQISPEILQCYQLECTKPLQLPPAQYVRYRSMVLSSHPAPRFKEYEIIFFDALPSFPQAGSYYTLKAVDFPPIYPRSGFTFHLAADSNAAPESGSYRLDKGPKIHEWLSDQNK